MTMTINETDHPLYKTIYKRVYHKKQNALILIVGDVGTGKSTLALRIAEKLDPTFTKDNIRERVVIQPEQFSELIAKADDDKLAAGSVVIIDEAGASAMASRDWYSIGNKMISHILQTFRYRRLILIMTVPNMSFIDVHARKLINFLIETKKIDFNTRKTKARVWKLNFNKISGQSDPYRIRFTKKDEYGEDVTLDCMWFTKPDIKLVHAYDKYADEFKQGIIEKAMTNIAKTKNKVKKKQFDAREIAEKIISNKDRYFKENGRMNRGLIEVEFGIGENRSRQVRSTVKMLLLDQSGGT